ncbi:hypothetical protein [Arsenicibacter rosenii]|uniref:DUF4595 domain-containing protein n=1 Tax=Arsenicibacter rosenii TaxID=1750698 RepID=A0A1S2VPP6_9BACT|nr:hypothetical protein [Arsenicibacter rosenii]OIN60360.1 hypothetical protein BLX24_05915 [Arsenicibacter rosenii]
MRTIVSKVMATLSVAAVLTLAACQPDQKTISPDPNQGKTPPKDTTRPNPNNGGDVSVYKRVKIAWSASDYVEYVMDGSNKILRYWSQYIYIQGTDKLHLRFYDFVYNEKQEVKRLLLDNGAYVTYTYYGGQVSHTEEFAANGKLLATRDYSYSADGKQLTGIQEYQFLGTVKSGMRYEFAYTNGNLTEIRQLQESSEKEGVYALGMVTRFAQYDRQKNVENLSTIYPYLPDVVFRVNNPGLVTFYNADGTEITNARKQYTYTYNAQGYVLTRKESGAGGTSSADYTYTGL